ncbi:MAG: hypothetical protein CYG59_24565 [Chloroflexi bacterium]|nr:MAG: hypothetical protein CYG59_24565 [Chloroflexota bacterium]
MALLLASGCPLEEKLVGPIQAAISAARTRHLPANLPLLLHDPLQDELPIHHEEIVAAVMPGVTNSRSNPHGGRNKICHL